MVSFRSTKGASKQRRDLINAEIGVLRDLLPLPENSRQRLSQLQIMSLACCFIRKNSYFSRLFDDIAFPEDDRGPFQFSRAMAGFLLIISTDGKLLYVSENVADFLGHSMVDIMTQGDTIYDHVDKKDHGLVQSHLTVKDNANIDGAESAFFCRMNVSRTLRRQGGCGDHKVMHVRGRFVMPKLGDHTGNQPVFMAVCDPLLTPDMKDSSLSNNTMTFQTLHRLDMKIVEVSQNGEYYLGQSEETLKGQSWYSLLHPESLREASEKHKQLINSSLEMGCMLTVKMSTGTGDWIWVNVVMHIRQPYTGDEDEAGIVCINQVIAESEAHQFKLQSQRCCSHIARSPEFLGSSNIMDSSQVISKVSLDSDQMSVSSTDAVFYPSQTDYPMVPTPAGKHDSSTRDHHFASLLPDLYANQTSGSDISSSSSTTSSPKALSIDAKQIRHTEVLNRLKRKMSQVSQNCKPSIKKARIQEPKSGSRDQVMTAQPYLAEPIFDPTYSSFASSGVDVLSGHSVLSSGAPMHAQLKMTAIESVSKPEPVVSVPMMSPEYNYPMTPLTPASSCWSDTEEKVDFTSLNNMIDPHALPSSMITPESSPSHSTDGFAELQIVPSIVDVDETFLSDLESDDEKPAKARSDSCTDAALLPELDVLSLESFLANPITGVELSPCDSSSVCSSPEQTMEPEASPLISLLQGDGDLLNMVVLNDTNESVKMEDMIKLEEVDLFGELTVLNQMASSTAIPSHGNARMASPISNQKM